MQIICPLYNSPYYSYTIDLSSQTYTLTFLYTSRSQGYTMDIQDAEENFIILGVKLVPVYPLIGQFSLPEIPGEFFLLPVEESSLATCACANNRRIHESHVLLYIDEL